MGWLGKLLSSATPRRESQVSIWSVTARGASAPKPARRFADAVRRNAPLAARRLRPSHADLPWNNRRHSLRSLWRLFHGRTFFRIAGTLWVVALAFIVYKSVADSPARAVGARSIGDSILAVLADFGNVGIAIGILSMVLALWRTQQE